MVVTGVVSPWLKSPFTDLTASMINHQWFGRCADLELKALDCFEAYGLDKGLTKCEDLLEDFKECASRSKQFQRIEAMKAERERQYKAGERTKEELYAKSPAYDSY